MDKDLNGKGRSSGEGIEDICSGNSVVDILSIVLVLRIAKVYAAEHCEAVLMLTCSLVTIAAAIVVAEQSRSRCLAANMRTQAWEHASRTDQLPQLPNVLSSDQRSIWFELSDNPPKGTLRFLCNQGND